MSKSVDFVFNISTSYTSWDRAIRLVASGRVHVAPFVTHRGGLERWLEFFTALERRRASRASSSSNLKIPEKEKAHDH